MILVKPGMVFVDLIDNEHFKVLSVNEGTKEMKIDIFKNLNVGVRERNLNRFQTWKILTLPMWEPSSAWVLDEISQIKSILEAYENT